MDAETTSRLLDRHRRGDAEALKELLVLHLPSIRAYVHRFLPHSLRRDDDTMDVVIQVLKNGPRVAATTASQFEKLVGAIVTRRIFDRLDHQRTKKRDVTLEAGSLDDSALGLRPAAELAPGPATEAARRELAAEIRLALEFLPPDARQMVLWRDFERLPLADIGTRLGITAAAAHMRCVAAHEHLTDVLVRLRSKRFDDLAAGIFE